MPQLMNQNQKLVEDHKRTFMNANAKKIPYPRLDMDFSQDLVNRLALLLL